MSRPSPLQLAIAVLTGVVGLVLAGWALGALAAPARAGARLAAVDRGLDEIARRRPPAAPYGPGAVCDQPALAAAAALRERLARDAAAARLTARGLTVAPGIAGRRLAALDVGLQAEGSYEAATALVARLQAGRPEVFVDELELRPAAAGVRLSLTGRAFCWTSARR